MKKIFLIIISIILFYSCNQERAEETSQVDTVETQENVQISNIGIGLSETAKREVASWEEYQLLKTKIERYYKITKTEAVHNARELSELIKETSDTIAIKILDRPDVKMRFNVLYNHAFRLYDMASIPSITDDEVKSEVTGLLDAFSSVNDKINVIYKIAEYKKEFGSIVIDTTSFFSDDEDQLIEKQIKKTVVNKPTILAPKKSLEKRPPPRPKTKMKLKQSDTRLKKKS